eukprot:2812726-Prymnesium_polylepis.1
MRAVMACCILARAKSDSSGEADLGSGAAVEAGSGAAVDAASGSAGSDWDCTICHNDCMGKPVLQWITEANEHLCQHDPDNCGVGYQTFECRRPSGL